VIARGGFDSVRFDHKPFHPLQPYVRDIKYSSRGYHLGDREWRVVGGRCHLGIPPATFVLHRGSHCSRPIGTMCACCGTSIAAAISGHSVPLRPSIHWKERKRHSIQEPADAIGSRTTSGPPTTGRVTPSDGVRLRGAFCCHLTRTVRFESRGDEPPPPVREYTWRCFRGEWRSAEHHCVRGAE
jgi:hypothetical protein